MITTDVPEIRQYTAAAICLMKTFPETIGQMDHAEVLDRCVAGMLTTEIPPLRWGLSRQNFLQHVIADRISAIITHESRRVGIGSESDNAKRLVSHLLDLVGLEPERSIDGIDDVNKLYAIEAELRRISGIMKVSAPRDGGDDDWDGEETPS
jgi:hypothetical protein